MAVSFRVEHQDPETPARVGTLATPHGTVTTPAWMPVGTKGAVKGVRPEELVALGTQMVLANTYHLMVRPGPQLVARMGGLPAWMRFPGPVLTDSGGFQAFRMSEAVDLDEDAVRFRSEIDGTRITLTPARAVAVQNQLGADVIMALDDCPPAPGAFPDAASYRRRVEAACARSTRWLDEAIAAHHGAAQRALFGIVQGGTDLELRRQHAAEIVARDLPGYALGGVAVGEAPEALWRVVAHTAPLLPSDRPRYLMGVGYERDLLAAVRSGVDLFDCVLPTRNARNGNAFTPTGQLKLRNADRAEDPAPIDPACDCPACAGAFSRSYLRHLFQAGEMLGPILVTLHNVRHFHRFMLDIREAIYHNAWPSLLRRWPVAASEAPD